MDSNEIIFVDNIAKYIGAKFSDELLYTRTQGTRTHSRPEAFASCLTRCVTMHSMEKTITIRLDREQDEALTQRAKTVGKTRSALVRELLAQALSERPISERAGHLEGSIQLPKPKDAWSKHLRKQNWR